MAALPFGAHSDPVGPAAVPANGTAVVATANAPYVTQTPTAADATHIASTAYVKGAYNDAIAAVNKVANTVDGKQAQLLNSGNNHAMYNKVFGGGNVMGLGGTLIDVDNPEYAAIKEDIAMQLSDGETGNPDETLISTGAVLDIVHEAGRRLRDETQSKQNELVNFDNGNAMYNQVLDSGNLGGLGTNLINMSNQEYAAARGDIAMQVSESETDNPDEILISTGATLQIVRSAGQTLQSNMNTALSNKRVEIYTTWENDNAKQQVAFVNAQ